MDQATRDKIVGLMQKDLDTAKREDPTWLDQPVHVDNGKSYTPPQIVEEVKNGTAVGDKFAAGWYENYQQVEMLRQAFLGKDPTTDVDGTSDGQSN